MANLTRRKTLVIIFTCITIFLGHSCGKSSEGVDWKLSMQSYTFHLFTVPEALDKTAELGLNYIEIYPGQRMGPEFEDAVFGYDLSIEQQDKLKELAASKNIKIVSSGVWTANRDEWTKIFTFAKNMELEFISAEPAREDWDVVERLAEEHSIKVAVHNHPNENSYWKPEILLDHIGNRSLLLGACVDVGHFKRMNVDPLIALKELEDRIISLHFKDIAQQDSNEGYDDVIWGTGILDIESMLKELKRQNFSGYFTIEYEADWENNLPQIKESIEYFNKTAEAVL